eukprot:SAG11_NODE_1579_length_4652_cov_5.253459_6_plen_107_part_00
MDATTTGTHGSTTPLGPGTQALTSDVRPPLALHLDHAGSVSTAAGHFCCHHTLLQGRCQPCAIVHVFPAIVLASNSSRKSPTTAAVPAIYGKQHIVLFGRYRRMYR